MISVIKHIPGHGCSTKDSHVHLPKVNLSRNNLNHIDFFPFKSNSAKLAMTAHILYSKIDKKNVSTFSKKIINKIIRKKIGFKGILISDYISMKALKYDLITNAKKSLEAGCNLVLYCGGNIKENVKLIKSVPYIDKFTAKKLQNLQNFKVKLLMESNQISINIPNYSGPLEVLLDLAKTQKLIWLKYLLPDWLINFWNL